VTAKLVIGNKTYSSWSMRPWLLMRVLEIPFDELVLPLYAPETRQAIDRLSPAGKVPILVDGGITVWDSLAIIEYLAERHPERGVWPADPLARARARSLAAEMHAGFLSLRRAMPMNLSRAPKRLKLDAAARKDVEADVRRIEAAFAEAKDQFGGGGPFLFGRFCAVDAMYAPVLSRFHTYAVGLTAATQTYMDAVKALPAWGDWAAGAAAEGWRVERFEVA